MSAPSGYAQAYKAALLAAFKIAASSTAILAGAPMASGDDFFGIPRRSRCPIDIGAHQRTRTRRTCE